MSSWVGSPGRPPYGIPCGSAGLKKTKYRWKRWPQNILFSPEPLFSCRQLKKCQTVSTVLSSLLLIMPHQQEQQEQQTTLNVPRPLIVPTHYARNKCKGKNELLFLAGDDRPFVQSTISYRLILLPQFKWPKKSSMHLASQTAIRLRYSLCRRDVLYIHRRR